MSGVEVGDCIEGSGTDLQIIIIVALAGTCFDVMGLSSLKVAKTTVMYSAWLLLYPQ